MVYFNRNVLLLLFAQLIFVSGSAMTVTMGGIVGSQLAPDPRFATLPISLTVLGTALGTVPATLIMKRIGRRYGFMTAAIIAACSTALAGYALTIESFLVYCVATATTGFTLAFSQQFRFAAAESVEFDKAGQAISFILLGSIGGAVVGPELVASGIKINPESAFIGAVTGACVLFAVAALLLAFIKNQIAQTVMSNDGDETSRSALQLLKEPLFFLAVLAGVVGQGVMTFIMTATPVSMHVMDGHSLPDTAAVIRAHVLAMYIPSLISGTLISRLGERNLMLLGVLAYIATLAFGLAGRDIMHYSWSMILLGVGWNFLFIGGTTLLVHTYKKHERYTAQAINEALVFGTSAVGSLLAGTLLMVFGWNTLLMSTVPILVAIGLAIIALRKSPLPVHG